MKIMGENHESELNYMANAVTQAIQQQALHYHQPSPQQHYLVDNSSPSLPSFMKQSSYTGQRIITSGSLEIMKKEQELGIVNGPTILNMMSNQKPEKLNSHLK